MNARLGCLTNLTKHLGRAFFVAQVTKEESGRIGPTVDQNHRHAVALHNVGTDGDIYGRFFCGGQRLRQSRRAFGTSAGSTCPLSWVGRSRCGCGIKADALPLKADALPLKADALPLV